MCSLHCLACVCTGPTIAFIMFSMPIFAYLGIVVVESGIIGWHDLRPHIMRLYPSTRKRLAALPALRKELQDDLRTYLRKIGPKLGDIYFDKTVDWQKIQEENAKLGKEAASKKTK
jgi:glycerol-3-phosphate O-acyltransferase / dihydroxyacetone phosphate acyltransferase